jgi:hypothetical protein
VQLVSPFSPRVSGFSRVSSATQAQALALMQAPPQQIKPFESAFPLPARAQAMV